MIVSKVITIAVAHMNSNKNFKKVFSPLTAKSSIFETLSTHTAYYCNVITLKKKFCFPTLFCDFKN